MTQFCFDNWNKLPELIARSWKVEKVEEYVEQAGKTRIQLLNDALTKPCACGGRWLSLAKDLFQKNNLDRQAWVQAMLHSLEHGRSKGTLVCHAGHQGNEGKSFLYEGLEAVYGEDAVFSSPPKGGFPLLGLERCRLCVLDDWRFNEDVIGYPLQLLWFEGKPIVIARPQNQFSGHLKYTKDDPIFITTLLSDISSVKGKKIQGGDISMMIKRLKIFEFSQALEQPLKTKSCAHCFATLLLRSDVQQPFAAGQRHGEAPKRNHPGGTGETPERKVNCAAWSVDDVVSYLEGLSLAHVAPKFRDNGVDGAFLLELSEEDLAKELGLTTLQARKVKARLP